MQIRKTSLDDALIIEPDVFADSRGEFLESYSATRYEIHGIGPFVQDNLSQSSKGVLRGLHMQEDPYSQGKLVQCVAGKIWDVAVDVRENSPTFGKYHAEVLSADNRLQYWIPPGFLHGFISLEDNSVMHYKCTNPYSRDSERGVFWNDSDLAIKWPITPVKISLKDEQLPSFREFLAKSQA